MCRLVVVWRCAWETVCALVKLWVKARLMWMLKARRLAWAYSIQMARAFQLRLLMAMAILLALRWAKVRVKVGCLVVGWFGCRRMRLRRLWLLLLMRVL